MFAVQYAGVHKRGVTRLPNKFEGPILTREIVECDITMTSISRVS